MTVERFHNRPEIHALGAAPLLISGVLWAIILVVGVIVVRGL